MPNGQGGQPSDVGQLQHLQATLAAWHATTSKAWQGMLQDPKGSLEQLRELWRKSEGEVVSLSGLLDRWPEARTAFINPARLWICQGIAQAATLLQRDDEARWAMNEGLGLLDSADPTSKAERANLLNTLADLERRGERFDAAIVAYDEAFSLFSEAGLFDQAIMALASRAGCDLFRDDGDGFLNRMETAISLADRHDLKARAAQLRRDLYRFRIETDPTGEVLQEVDDLRKQGRLREVLDLDDAGLSQFVAEARAAGRDPGAVREQRKAIEKMREALQRDPTDIAGWARLGLILKQQAEELAEKDPTRAREIAREALTIAEERVVLPEYVCTVLGGWLRVLDRVEGPSAAQERARALEQLASLGSKEDLFQARVDEAFLRLKRGDPTAALAVLDEAEPLAETPDQLRLACMGRIVLLQETPGREADALALGLRAIAEDGVFHPKNLRGGSVSASRWSTQLGTAQSIHGNVAVSLCLAGRQAEAYLAAEQGRALRLRARFEEAGLMRDAATMVPQGDLLDQLREDSSALLFLWVGRKRTLALVIDPFATAEPQEAAVALGQAELRSRAPSESGNPWTEDALRALGERLWPSLKGVVSRCRSRGGTLLVAPDAGFFTVPFAALPDGSGGHLLDHCAVAVVPGASVWSNLRSRRSSLPLANCVVASAGEVRGADGTVFHFAEQAREIGALVHARTIWENVSSSDLLAAMTEAEMLHLEFHGIVEPTAVGTLSASALRCAGDEALTADEIVERHRGRLRAQLVFLNACMSGRFRNVVPGEVGGLWEAFLVGGAGSIVATLHEVDPRAARDVAVGFHSRWPDKGRTRGAALREAQLAVRAERPATRDWAAHVLIGDAY